MGPIDAHPETGADVVPPDGTAGDLPPAPDALDAHDAMAEAPGDAPIETGVEAPVDVPADVTTADVPTADVAPADVPADQDGSPDRPAADGGDARPEDQPCGPQGFHCNPFACDVARGICKTICVTDDDCYLRRTCTRGTCGGSDPQCQVGDECNSGICAQGACCQTACSGTCRSCRVPGMIGTCSFVPGGMPDLNGGCPDGGVCDGRGQCVPSSCTAEADCGRYHHCTSGRCVPCMPSCVSSSDCVSPNVCLDNNGCTICNPPPDAGTD